MNEGTHEVGQARTAAEMITAFMMRNRLRVGAAALIATNLGGLAGCDAAGIGQQNGSDDRNRVIYCEGAQEVKAKPGDTLEKLTAKSTDGSDLSQKELHRVAATIRSGTTPQRDDVNRRIGTSTRKPNKELLAGATYKIFRSCDAE